MFPEPNNLYLKVLHTRGGASPFVNRAGVSSFYWYSGGLRCRRFELLEVDA